MHGGRARKRSTRVTDVLPTHEVLDQLAGRIEQAYSLRRPRWLRGCSTSRVWHMASLRLWEAHASDPERIPLDPELFVASQPLSKAFSDPWSELAYPESTRRYQSSVRQIIRQLRAELKREIVGSQRAIREGDDVGRVLNRLKRGLSSLGATSSHDAPAGTTSPFVLPPVRRPNISRAPSTAQRAWRLFPPNRTGRGPSSRTDIQSPLPFRP